MAKGRQHIDDCWRSLPSTEKGVVSSIRRGVEYGLLEAVGPEARWPRNREGPESPKNITELEGVEDH
jgi:hypothetical protein